MTEIKICMGSACFVKGNQTNLQFIERYIAENKLDAKLTVVGTLCKNKCSQGPRICINDKEYLHVTESELKNLLKEI